jgi:hypothetical protein
MLVVFYFFNSVIFISITTITIIIITVYLISTLILFSEDPFAIHTYPWFISVSQLYL